MKIAIFASVIAAALVLGTLAFGDDGKASAQELTKPENLASQVIDTGKDASTANTASNEKSGDDDAKPVPHFAGHAFAE